ncbi:MAG: hypothetical protein IPP13_03640 [Kouleothrix sp.]|nr:hypothetical protein [Kouleothrix sp.]
MSQLMQPSSLVRWAASEGLTLGGLFGFGYGIIYLLLTVLWIAIPVVVNSATLSDASVVISVLLFGLPIVVFGSICGALVGLLCGGVLGVLFTQLSTRRQRASIIYILTTFGTAFIALMILWVSDGWYDYTFRVLPGVLMLPACWILTARFLRREYIVVNQR